MIRASRFERDPLGLKGAVLYDDKKKDLSVSSGIFLYIDEVFSKWRRRSENKWNIDPALGLLGVRSGLAASFQQIGENRDYAGTV